MLTLPLTGLWVPVEVTGFTDPKMPSVVTLISISKLECENKGS